MTAQPTPILALDRVTKTFGHGPGAVHAARSISFSLHAGRALALVGESGSGKTTCARMAMREYMPTEGKILFRGEPVDGACPVPRSSTDAAHEARVSHVCPNALRESPRRRARFS